MYENDQLTELGRIVQEAFRVLITPILLSFRLCRMRMRTTRTMR